MKLIQTNICKDLSQEYAYSFQQRVVELEDGFNLMKLRQLIKNNLGHSISDTGLVKTSTPYNKGLFIPTLDNPVLSRIDSLGRCFGIQGIENGYEFTSLISVLEDAAAPPNDALDQIKED